AVQHLRYIKKIKMCEGLRKSRARSRKQSREFVNVWLQRLRSANIGSLISRSQPPQPHTVIHVHNEEKVKNPPEAHDVEKSLDHAMAATSLMLASQLAFIGVFSKDALPYQIYIGLTSMGFLFLGIAIAVMLRNKIGFPDERHRGHYAVYAFYALAIAIMMVVVVLSSG
nr:hypothetical protein [Tanacetum cinerariifolium]